MTTAMIQMMVYLTAAQKKALQKKARARSASVAAEVRNAVDAYLAGVLPQELQLLDAATKQAQADIEAMRARLDHANRQVDDILRQREALHRTGRATAAA